MVKLIAITGNIGSGKTYLREYLGQIGFKTFSADKIIKNLYEEEIIQQQVMRVLPKLAVFDKKSIAAIIFSDDQARLRLENFMHPLVNIALSKFEYDNANEALLFAEMPLLFENKSSNRFAAVILTYCNDKSRYQRVKERLNFDLDHYKKINDIQLPYSQTINLCNYSLDTSKEKGIFANEVKIIIKNLKKNDQRDYSRY